ncbi:hypothetical protein [Cardinium endosymbiont of Sogatella furcifera]|uniref:hypothetical protein n=1 Tax=Cardinium endosymbiont of Sogatella furcifera TaxID=650378 RepID=UPI000E0D3905|nr:hypothetical protein [Cardinium endosymbiont of Sogatella furcifera]
MDITTARRLVKSCFNGVGATPIAEKSMKHRYIFILWLLLLSSCHTGIRQGVHPVDPSFTAGADGFVGVEACAERPIDAYPQTHGAVYLMTAPRPVTPAAAVVAAVDTAITRWVRSISTSVSTFIFRPISRAINYLVPFVPCYRVRDPAAQA